MKKLLFLFVFLANLAKAQSIIFTSESFEGANGLTNTAYRGVGDSIQRFLTP